MRAFEAIRPPPTKRIPMPRQRLTTPLVRVDGELVPATWDEALDRVAAGFAAVQEKGETAFGMFSCSKSTNEMNYAAQRFALSLIHI